MYCLVVFFILKDFCKLKEQFLRVWENFAPPPRIRPSFFAPGQGIRQKIARVAGIRSLKNIFPGVARGDISSWNLTETLLLDQLSEQIVFSLADVLSTIQSNETKNSLQDFNLNQTKAFRKLGPYSRTSVLIFYCTRSKLG